MHARPNSPTTLGSTLSDRPSYPETDHYGLFDALDTATQAEIEDLVCEHSLMYSRGSMGFTELTDEERETLESYARRPEQFQ